jgi:hypothetical protein
MQTTLRKFIDPENIPKKYGGELDFQFGQAPVLDPALKDVLTWQGGYRDFPHGPMYWKYRGDHLELIAVGSVQHKERHEIVCTVRKTVLDHVTDEKANGAPKKFEDRPELLTAPIAEESVPLAEKDTEPLSGNGEISLPEVVNIESKAQEGEFIPASRPGPVSFVTAEERLESFPVKENEGSTPAENGVALGPDVTPVTNAEES